MGVDSEILKYFPIRRHRPLVRLHDLLILGSSRLVASGGAFFAALDRSGFRKFRAVAGKHSFSLPRW